VIDSTEAIRIDVERKIDNFAEGNLDHATETFSALWKIAKKDGNIEAPLTTSQPSDVGFSSSSWGARVLNLRY
jgi:hypothetical protein